MREDEEALEREKRAKAREAQREKEREIAEMFGVPVSQARQLMTQMDPYMLQHIHQQLAAGHQIVMHGESDEDFDPSESGDEEEDDSDDGDFECCESESDEEEDDFDDAAEEMEAEEADDTEQDAETNVEMEKEEDE
jgi:hypothetical protein